MVKPTQNISKNTSQISSSSFFLSDDDDYYHHYQVRCQEDLKLKSFALLLSSAQTLGLHEPLLPLHGALLAQLLSPNVYFGKASPDSLPTCSFPSLSIQNEATAALAAAKGTTMQETAALNLAFPISVDRDDVGTAPVSLIENFSNSFMFLIKARLRSSINALLKKIANRGGFSEFKTLLKIICGDCSPIIMTNIVTSFRVLPTTEEVTGSNVFLPLVFEATMDLAVLGKVITVSAQAPGTITGSFNPVDGLLERIEIVFDTIVLLDSMMKQAKSVVRMAIFRSVGIAHKMVTSKLKKPSMSLLSSFSLHNLQTSTSDINDCFSGCSSLNSSFSLNKKPRHKGKYLSFFHKKQYCSNKQPLSDVPFGAIPIPSIPATDFKCMINPIPCTITSNSVQPMKRKDKDKPYQLFSRLEGDPMYLKEDDDVTDTSTSQCNQYDRESCSQPIKKRKVSFECC